MYKKNEHFSQEEKFLDSFTIFEFGDLNSTEEKSVLLAVSLGLLTIPSKCTCGGMTLRKMRKERCLFLSVY